MEFERGRDTGALHHLAVSPLELNLSLLEAACDDVVSTEQYETPTQQQLSILTPPTGFRTEARTDACETQCDEEGDHGELTTPLTTNAANMIGLKKECTELQCDPAIAPLSSSTALTPAPSSTPPQSEAPPTSVSSSTPPRTEAPPTSVSSSTPSRTEAPPTSVPSSIPPQTEAPPTSVPSSTPPWTKVPPTSVPSSTPPQTEAPPTSVPLSTPPRTEAPPTSVPSSTSPRTEAPPTSVPSSTPPWTEAPPTSVPLSTPPWSEAPPTRSPLPGRETAYKALYHRAIEQLRVQSTELAAFRRLVPLVAQLKAAKREHTTEMQKTSEELALCHSAVEKKIKTWTKERERYKDEEERTVAELVAELVACSATNKVLGEELTAMRTRLHVAEDVAARQQGLLRHKKMQLEACAAETCELKEFTELEKQTLDDTVVELQQKLRERQNTQLLQMEKHQEEASRLREEVERLNVQLKREAIKSYRYQAFSDRFVEHIQTHSRKAGKDGCPLELDGDTVRRTLAQWRAISFPKGAENVPPEGADEEWEKVQLATQVLELNDKLCSGRAEYSRLKQMFHDYQAKSAEKVEVLKYNLEKADEEIHQLDDIVDKVVTVMQENIATIRECPPLHNILKELLGAQD